MDQQLHYISNALDRAHELRKESIENLLDEHARILPIWRSRNLFDFSQDLPRIALLETSLLTPLNHEELLLLGSFQGQRVFALDYSVHEPESLSWFEETQRFEGVREMIASISIEEANLLAYARAMMTWHRNHAFCGRCGSPTRSKNNGHERICTNPSCQHVSYPRVDPAVIVLIERKFEDGIERCLLARNKRSTAGMYSTLAGFVEPGESLEMTVEREMMEEAGIAVNNIRYMASQPWPFPSSLMMGFFATAQSADIVLDEDELSEARWFSRDELHQLSKAGEIHLSREDSIARYLIRTWMEK